MILKDLPADDPRAFDPADESVPETEALPGQEANSQASVLTLVRGREPHLHRMIEGLKRQSVPPGELVIAFMQPRPVRDLPETPFPVRSLIVNRDHLPLAEARNAAARSASYRKLIFLDVDCIPGPDLVASYMKGLSKTDGVLQGEVVYLPDLGAKPAFDYELFEREGRPHPSRPSVPGEGLSPESDMGMLWGLNFAMHRKLFLKVGGLDERFTGYGGEETDFARGLARLGATLHWCGGARAYHQHHEIMRPPLQHFTDIVRNARLFRDKWGEWCMDYWLGQLHREGYIDWNDRRITVLRRPTPDDLRRARCEGDVLFS